MPASWETGLKSEPEQVEAAQTVMFQYAEKFKHEFFFFLNYDTTPASICRNTFNACVPLKKTPKTLIHALDLCDGPLASSGLLCSSQ